MLLVKCIIVMMCAKNY